MVTRYQPKRNNDIVVIAKEEYDDDTVERVCNKCHITLVRLNETEYWCRH